MGESKYTCVVLGGAGFIGSAIVREAGVRGYDVRSVGRQNYQELSGTRCDLLIDANGNSKKYLAKQDPKDDFDKSVQSVVNSLHDFQTSCYVYLSSVDVYSDVSDPSQNDEMSLIDAKQLSAYGFHKYIAEQLVRFYVNSWLVFRMGAFVGHGLWKNPIYDILKHQQPHIHPDSINSYLNTCHLAQLVFQVFESGCRAEIFNVTGDGIISLRKIAAMVPGYNVSKTSEMLPIERYNINIEKIKARVHIPQTTQVVRQFIADVLSGKETIR